MLSHFIFTCNLYQFLQNRAIFVLKLGESHDRRFAPVYQDIEFQTLGGGGLYYTVDEFGAFAYQRDGPPGAMPASFHSQEQWDYLISSERNFYESSSRISVSKGLLQKKCWQLRTFQSTFFSQKVVLCLIRSL